MTKEVKNIIKKDLKKYKSIAEVSEGDNKEIFEKIVMFLEEILD